MAEDRGLVVAVGLMAALLTLGAVAILVAEVPHFWDPCRSWGDGSSGSGSSTISITPEEPCQGKSGTSETKLGAATRLLLVCGTALVASVLAVVGAVRRRPLPSFVAAGLMAGETALLFFGISAAFILTLMAGVIFLVAGLQWRKRHGWIPVAAAPGAGTGPRP